MEGRKGSYDFSLKLKVIEYTKTHSKRVTAREFKVDRERVQEWCKDEAKIQSLARSRKRLLGHAQELEAMVEAPFDPTAAGLLVPDVVTRPDKEVPGGGRKRLTAMHGSVTMQGLDGPALPSAGRYKPDHS